MEEYCTVTEAKKLLGLSEAHIRTLLQEEKLQGQKIGRDWLIHIPSLDRHQNAEHIPTLLRMRVMLRDKATCQDCKLVSDDGDGLHVHHIKARSKGGGDNLNNLTTLCRPCHNLRHGCHGIPTICVTYRLSQEVIDELRRLAKLAGGVDRALRKLMRLPAREVKK